MQAERWRPLLNLATNNTTANNNVLPFVPRANQKGVRTVAPAALSIAA